MSIIRRMQLGQANATCENAIDPSSVVYDHFLETRYDNDIWDECKFKV